MNKEETLALYKQGKDAWNKWAGEILAERKKLEESGEWEERKKDWRKRAKTDFSDHTFQAHENFDLFIFPGETFFQRIEFLQGAGFAHTVFYGHTRFQADFLGDADFTEACFLHDLALFNATIVRSEARFPRAVFHGRVFFPNTHFMQMAHFNEVQFLKEADFNSSIFEKSVNFCSSEFLKGAKFIKATFKGDANFASVDFKCDVAFSNARFDGDVTFCAMNSERGFDLSDASFAVVPDFIQAHFLEAPRLDDVKIPEDAPRTLSLRGAKGDEAIQSEEDSGLLRSARNDITARYRALKRMAIQAHDHRREQDFFAAELKSMRGVEHFPKGSCATWYWLGCIYESLSDFGRSPLRVLEWMYIQCFVFAYFYGLTSKGNLECISSGKGDIVTSALMLSIGKTVMPFIQANSEKNIDYMRCLFGHKDAAPFVADIPLWFNVWGIAQSLFSLLLIFLLLLSIRAHFRVK